MPVEPLWIYGYVAAAFLLVAVVAQWSLHAASLQKQILELRLDMARREQHLESLSRTHKQQVDALLAKLDVHQDDGGKCRTIPRDRKTVAEMLRQRKSREKNADEWEKINEEQGLTGVEVTS